MLSFSVSMAAWFLATFLPAVVGMTVAVFAQRVFEKSLVSAFAIGIFLWFFVDTVAGSANLDVNQGFTGGLTHFSVFVLFVFGLLFFFFLGYSAFNSDKKIHSFFIPLLASIAVGIHGLGEGAAFGGTASLTTSTDLIETFGGLSAAVAYLLHKALEPVMVAACYSMYASASSNKRLIVDSLFLAFVFSLTSLIGAITGYFFQYDATYLFALGAGSSVFVAIVLAKNFLSTQLNSRVDVIKISIAILLGFLSIYVAALFHS